MKKLRLLLTLILASGFWTLAQSQTNQEVVMKSDTDLVKVYVKQDPSTYKKANQENAQVLEFAVQLSASSKPVTDISSLKSWEELGSLYIHTENGMYKVRIGPFDTQDKAKEVLLRAKERGKKDAFIVIQKGLENYSPQGYARLQAVEPETELVKHEAKISNNTAPLSSDESVVEYKVRLASYLKPGGFSTKEVDQYGPLESYRQGEWTIMLIGGFKTEQDAIRVRDLVIAKGFKDASVVIDRGGVLEFEH